MAEFIKGDVVIVPFPFSNLTTSKKRPALVLSVLKGDDLILCQITSKEVNDLYAILLEEVDFEQGSLKQISNIRPNKIFTADKNIILYRVGHLTTIKMDKVIHRIIEILDYGR